MATWVKTVDIAQHLRDDATPLPERAEQIHNEFVQAGVYEHWASPDLLNHLEELKEQAKTGDPDYFDVPLARIYDWCDEHRIWCGI